LRGEHERQQVLELLRSGQWQLMALETQLLTQLARPSELRASVDWACRFGEQHGIPVRGAMLNDIGGYARGLPSAIAPRGIQYLAGGVGGFRALLPWADLPWLINWRAPDGQTLLVWHVDLDPLLPLETWPTLPASYGFGFDLCLKPVKQLLRDGVEDRDGIDAAWREYERQLQRRGYPYRQIMLQFAGDNDGIDRDVPRWIEHWNATIDRPKLRLATPDEFFSDLLNDIAIDQIPQRSGELHDPWIDHAATQPAAFAVYRENGRRIEALRAHDDSADLDEAVRQQLWFSDHTFGLSMWECNERIKTQLGQAAASAPEMTNWVESWADKQLYPKQAAQHIAAAEARQWPGQTMAYTAQPQPLAATVRLPWKPRVMADEDVQVAADGQVWAYLSGVASDSPRPLDCGDSAASPTPPTAAPVLCDTHWHIAFDPETGALTQLKSLSHPAANIGPAGFADLTVYDVNGLTERPMPAEMLDEIERVPNAIRWHNGALTTAGPLVSEVVRRGVIALPEGDQQATQHWRLLHREGILEIETIWDKLPRVRHEASYLGLSLRFDQPRVWIDQGLTVAEVGRDELPGCFRDQYCVHDWVAVADETSTLLVAPREMGLVEVDRVRLHDYATQPFAPATGMLHFMLTHNYWPTNCPRWQEGRLTYTLRLQLLEPNQSSRSLREAGARLAWPVLISSTP
jgi:hypothetical protein